MCLVAFQKVGWVGRALLFCSFLELSNYDFFYKNFYIEETMIVCGILYKIVFFFFFWFELLYWMLCHQLVSKFLGWRCENCWKFLGWRRENFNCCCKFFAVRTSTAVIGYGGGDNSQCVVVLGKSHSKGAVQKEEKTLGKRESCVLVRTRKR